MAPTTGLWPGGAKCAVLVTFDFDAETLWLSRDMKNEHRLATMSLGTYGAKVGVPKVLELMRQLEMPATFFVPGWTAERHRGALDQILEAGHEVGHHGYLHLWPDFERPDEIAEEFGRGMEVLERLAGRPVGYRAPGGETCEQLMGLIRDAGMLYDSTLKDDYRPYRFIHADGTPGVVEIPENPSVDDTAYGLSHLKNSKPFFGKQHVLDIWKGEFEETYDWGGLYMLVLHPQVSGRPIRLAILREFLAWTRSFPGVWYADARQVAERFREVEAAGAAQTAVPA